MRFPFAATAAVALLATGPITASAAPSTHPTSIPGYLDPSTGRFEPLTGGAPTGTATTGEFAFTLTVAEQTAVQSSSFASCEVDLSLVDPGDTYAGSVSTSILLDQTPTAKTKVYLPYAWKTADPSKATVQISVDCFASAFTDFQIFYSAAYKGAIALPKNGSKTAVAAQLAM